MVFTRSLCILVLVAAVWAGATARSQSYKLAEDVEVTRTGPQSDVPGGQGLEDALERYVQDHDVTVQLPLGAAATVSAKDMDSGVMNFKLKFSNSDVGEERSKKKKIKKILIPIAVLLLLKAMTLIPLILGILGIKTWNALQLSFITFLTSFGMAIYELLKKFASDHPPAIVTHVAHGHHGHHDHHDHHDHHEHHWAQHRSIDENAQQMAYKAY